MKFLCQKQNPINRPDCPRAASSRPLAEPHGAEALAVAEADTCRGEILFLVFYDK